MKNSKSIGITIMLLVIFGSTADCQQSKSTGQSVSLNFLQIKEGLNHGLVFRGPGLQYSRYWQWENDWKIVNYEANIGFAYLEARGIGAGNIHLMAGRISYLRKIGNSKKLSAGLSFTSEYNYELYPDLQSGYSFWFTHYSVGGVLSCPFQLGKNQFNLNFHTSLMGLTSRPPAERDAYFYDLNLGDVIRFVHQDFRFGSWDRYNQTGLEIKWQPKPSSRLAITYVLNYYGYYKGPEISMLDQAFKLTFVPKKYAQ